MGFLLALFFAVLFFGATVISSKLPAKVQIILIISLSLGVAWLHWSIAKTQLATTGFAAGNRNPNYLARDIGYALAAMGIVNCGLVFIRLRFAAVTLGLLFTLIPVLYLLSW